MSMTTSKQFITIEHTRGVLIRDYAEFLLSLVAVPPDATVSVIILGHDGPDCMVIHFEPLSDEQFAKEQAWLQDCDVYAETYATSFDGIIAAAKLRWPGVRIFRVPGCLCCNGLEDLREYNCEC